MQRAIDDLRHVEEVPVTRDESTAVVRAQELPEFQDLAHV